MLAAIAALQLVSNAHNIAADDTFRVENPAAIPLPYEYTDQNTWLHRRVTEADSLICALSDPSRVKVVFIGNSITHGWTKKSGTIWKDYFGTKNTPYYALNIGIPGDRTEHLLYRLQSNVEGGMGHLDCKRIDPKVIVLMIGTNNYFRHSKHQLIPGTEAVVERLRELRPDAHIVLCSILPNADTVKNYDSDIIVPTNNASRILASKDPGITYLDLYTEFLDEDGTLNKNLYNSWDLIHPNKSGYQVWFDNLRPILDEILYPD
jgi:lysophospholipase L1-like esterase